MIMGGAPVQEEDFLGEKEMKWKHFHEDTEKRNLGSSKGGMAVVTYGADEARPSKQLDSLGGEAIIRFLSNLKQCAQDSQYGFEVFDRHSAIHLKYLTDRTKEDFSFLQIFMPLQIYLQN